jgi:hypothetical protein
VAARCGSSPRQRRRVSPRASRPPATRRRRSDLAFVFRPRTCTAAAFSGAWQGWDGGVRHCAFGGRRPGPGWGGA